jgi:hypothetical protein
VARIPIGTQLTDALRFTPQEEISRVAEYLMRKEGIDKNDPKSEEFINHFETTAKEDYKHRGVIRNQSHAAEEQARLWQAQIDHWTKDRDNNPGSIIRKQRFGVQGTIEAMQAVLPCIKNGCLADPWDMAAMHMDTHLQKQTGLQVLVVIASV